MSSSIQKSTNTPDIEHLSAVSKGDAILSAACYTDKDFAQFEKDKLFSHGWVGVCFGSDIPNPGDVVVSDVLDQPMMITRDASNKIQVFANVCRHRGHRLVKQNCKGKKSFTCPYHAWSYKLNGEFSFAPFWDGSQGSVPSDAERNRMGLLPIRHEIWYDVIFVNLDEKAVFLAELVAPLNERWNAGYPEDELKCFSQKDYTIPGNWKLAAENFLDNYHLPWVHPEIGENIEASIGLSVENIKLSEDIIGFTHPTAGEEKVKTTTPLPNWSSLSGGLEHRQDLFFIFPNVCMVMEGNYLWTMLLLPTDTDVCEERLSLYVAGEDAMSDYYSEAREQLETVIYRINEQDRQVIQQLQLGRQGDSASHGIFNPVHDQLGMWFHQSVAAKLALE